MRITSASSVQGMATSTGPKISSRARRQSLATFAKDGGDCVIAFAKGPFLGWETADHEARFASLKSFLDTATHFPELLLVDDGTYVTCLIERITELERFDLLPKRIKKTVEDVAV